MLKLTWTENALEDLNWWQQHDAKMLKRIIHSMKSKPLLRNVGSIIISSERDIALTIGDAVATSAGNFERCWVRRHQRNPTLAVVDTPNVGLRYASCMVFNIEADGLRERCGSPTHRILPRFMCKTGTQPRWGLFRAGWR